MADNQGTSELKYNNSEIFGTASGAEKQCCICMKKDTKLLHLCLVNGGGSTVEGALFSLLLDRKDASSEDNQEPTRLIICWECDAITSKVVRFREQACRAQKRLTNIAEGRTLVPNSYVVIPPEPGSRRSGPEAILEYRTETNADPSQPFLRVVRYLLPESMMPALPAAFTGSSLRDLIEGIQGIEELPPFNLGAN